jgi:hypothetical protein
LAAGASPSDNLSKVMAMGTPAEALRLAQVSRKTPNQ